MKKLRLHRGLCLLLALALCLTGALAALPTKPANGYVTDAANVLTSDTINYIVSQNEALTAENGAAIVVVTVDFLDGESIDDYATDLFNEWGIGDAEQDNGLLILLAIGEDNYYTLQGAGLQTMLTSSAMADYNYTYLEEDFAAGDYDSGVRKLFDAYYEWFENDYVSYINNGVGSGNAASSTQPLPEQSAPARGGVSILRVLGIFLGIAIVALIVAALFSSAGSGGGTVFFVGGGRHRRRPPRGPRPPMGGGPRPPVGGGGRPPREPRPPMGGGRPTGGLGGGSRGSFGGGMSRGGGAGRGFGGGFGGGSHGGFSGGSRGGFGGGASRGGGAGRR